MIGIVLVGDYWEGLYINREIISQGHSLEDANEWIRWTREFDLEGVKYIYLEDEDYDNLADSGYMLENLDDYIGHYE